MTEIYERIRAYAEELYGKEDGDALYFKLIPMIEAHQLEEETRNAYFTEKDAVLITYGDSLKQEGETPLATLKRFVTKRVADALSIVHILPCFPYSSDDGFSVIDYTEIDPALGTWDDIRALKGVTSLMFDLVLNHISAKSPWFQAYLAGKEGFEHLAIEVDPNEDLSHVTRPRALPLLSPFTKTSGETVHVWTTFSDDQIDLNYGDREVTRKMVEVLLRYAQEGATIIRLDAIAYLWKEIGTTCIHLPKTHTMVKLLRAVYNAVTPHGIILTETNVPHKENVSYFGNGKDEAQMVYNFTLPPLLLATFITKDTKTFTDWAKTLTTPSDETTFFNFTASHDGVGVRPLEGIVTPDVLTLLITRAEAQGGKVSYKQNADGSKSPYELNVTYVDAYREEGDDDETHAKRFLASQAVALALPGVPAVYIHSLLGSHNYIAGVKETGRARTINREKLAYDAVTDALDNEGSFRNRIFTEYTRMLRIRREHPAFHPNAEYAVLDGGTSLIVIERACVTERIVTVANVTGNEVHAGIEDIAGARDLLGHCVEHEENVTIPPYGVAWFHHTR